MVRRQKNNRQVVADAPAGFVIAGQTVRLRFSVQSPCQREPPVVLAASYVFLPWLGSLAALHRLGSPVFRI